MLPIRGAYGDDFVYLRRVRGNATARGGAFGLVVAVACSAESRRSKRPLRSTAIKLNESHWGGNVSRPRTADDFAAIRARMEELRRERVEVEATKADTRSDPPMRARRSVHWPDVDPRAGPGSPIRPDTLAARSRGAFLISA